MSHVKILIPDTAAAGAVVAAAGEGDKLHEVAAAGGGDVVSPYHELHDAGEAGCCEE